MKNVKKEQKEDKYVNSLRIRVINNEKIATKRYTIINDLLCQGDLNGAKRVMIPEKILDQIIAEIHEKYVHIESQKDVEGKNLRPIYEKKDKKLL